MSWRDYVNKEDVVAGPIEVWCCDKRVAVWVRDDQRPEWQMYAGRPWGTAREERDGRKQTELYGSGTDAGNTTRMKCSVCPTDFQRRMEVLAPMLDGLAGADIGRVELRSLARLV